MRKKRCLGKFVATLAACVILSHGYAVRLRAQESAEEWEMLASTRLEVAIGYDSRAEQKRDDALRKTNSTEAADLLHQAGDNKVTAFENYERAQRHWAKAAELHAALRDDAKAGTARDSADKSREAGKRALREAVELYMPAANMYGNLNNLDKKLEVNLKIAINMERLLKIK